MRQYLSNNQGHLKTQKTAKRDVILPPSLKSMEINLTLTCKCSAIEEMIKKWWLRNCRKEAWKLFKGIGSCASKYMFGAKPN